MGMKVSVRAAARAEKSAELARTADAMKKTKALEGAVVRTGDSFQNFEARIGIGAGSMADAGTYGFNPISRERTLLEWIHRGSWLGGLSVDLIPDDMTRAGVDILGGLKPEQIAVIEELATELNIWGSYRDNEAWGRLYGGSIGVHMVKGQNYSTPLRIDTVGKGQYRGILVLDRWMVEPSLNELVTEEGPRMGEPKYYRVNISAPGLRGEKIHYTRVVRAEGVRIPFQQRLTENLWSISVLERIYDRLIAFDSATQGAAQLVYKAYLRTYKMEGLRDAIIAGGVALDGIVGQIQHMARFQGNEGITLIDAKDEFATHQNQAMAGVTDILIHLGQQNSGGLQIPLVRLFGQSPVGLNSTGESDIKTYYENVRNQQIKRYKVPVTHTYRMLAQSLGIKPTKGFGIDFRPLWLLEESDKASVGEATQRTITGYVEAGLMTPQTAMREIRDSSAVTGIGSHITDAEIEAASDILPPAPELGAGAEPESEGAEPKLKLTEAA